MSFFHNIFSGHSANQAAANNHAANQANNHQGILPGGCVKPDHSTGPFNPNPPPSPFGGGDLVIGPPTNINTHSAWSGHHPGPGLY